MWNAPYHRDLLPSCVDNKDFGSFCPQLSLFQRDLTSKIFVNSDFRGPSKYAKSKVAGDDAASKKDVYNSCLVSFETAVTDPLPTTLFMPDHAALIEVENNYHLIQESLWHSEIFFNNYFRCDRSTDWQYRIKSDFEYVNVGGLIVNTYHRYSFQFFHWLFDSLPRIWLAKNTIAEKDIRWFIGPLHFAFQWDCLELFDINKSNILHPTKNPIIRFEDAYNIAFRFTEDLGTLRPDFSSGVYNVGWSEKYVIDLRSRAFSSVSSMNNGKYGDKIFVTRPDATHRRITNELEVHALLSRYGYSEFCPGEHSLKEQIKVFSNARSVIGTHGAGLSNIVWCPEKSSVAEFMPCGLDDVGYRFICNMLNHNHIVLKCKTFHHPLGVAYADIEIDVEMLEKIILSI